MSDNDLIREWNNLINRKYNHEEITIEDINNFDDKVQLAYKNNDITCNQYFKYAEIICYLSDTNN